jgi:MATE family multidrug resistance protein
MTDQRSHRSPSRSNPASMRGEARAMLVLAAPLSAAFLAQMAIGVTDIVMMGWLGPASLASGTLASNFLHLLFYFGMGLGTAVAPISAPPRRPALPSFWCSPFPSASPPGSAVTFSC